MQPTTAEELNWPAKYLLLVKHEVAQVLPKVLIDATLLQVN
jgi:hypothetical protein